jgi:ABC-type transport system involved in multi-copper enzyme maturation permease subunit
MSTTAPVETSPAPPPADDPAGASRSAEAGRTRPPRDWQAIRLIMGKDLRAVRRSKAIVLPMIIVPTVLLVLLPVLLGLFARSAPTDHVSSALSSPLLHRLAKPIVALPKRQQLVVLVLGYLLSPLLLVIPLMVSAVLAADAFAGEKERRTLEGLLLLPISDRDLFLAKVLSAFVPALVITWIGALLYAVLSNVIAWPVAHRLIIPFSQWFVVIGWIAPAVALLALGLLVAVSSRARTTQEANQLGGAVILPLIFLAAGYASVLLLVPMLSVFGVGVVIWAVAVGLLARNGRRFTRDRLATSS